MLAAIIVAAIIGFRCPTKDPSEPIRFPADAGMANGEASEIALQFEQHHKAWRTFADSPEMSLSSDTHQLTNHSDYKAIIAMGKRALPFVIDKLAKGDFLMVVAARRITGIDVVRASGKVLESKELFGEQDEARLWVEWWQQNRDKPEWQP